MQSRILLIFPAIIFLLFALSFALLTPRSYAQVVQVPVPSVTVEYPGCDGDNCSLVQASCSWGAATGAVSYKVTVIEVETSVAIKSNETVAAPTTKIVFPITQNRTYRCDVIAVSANGSQSTVVSDQLLCAADALLDGTPAVAPPGSSTAPPKKGIAAPGGVEQTILVIGAVIFTLAGGTFLLKRS